jgi:hypothetical protein
VYLIALTYSEWVELFIIKRKERGNRNKSEKKLERRKKRKRPPEKQNLSAWFAIA